MIGQATKPLNFDAPQGKKREQIVIETRKSQQKLGSESGKQLKGIGDDSGRVTTWSINFWSMKRVATRAGDDWSANKAVVF